MLVNIIIENSNPNLNTVMADTLTQSNCEIEIIKLLVKKGAIDFDNYLPLSKIHKCNKEIIKFLGDCKMYNDALIRFVNINSIENVKTCIENGANNLNDALSIAYSNKNKEIIELLESSGAVKKRIKIHKKK